MSEDGFKYIYGPVASWRLGNSLGIDLIATPVKHCTFDCIYCQLGSEVVYEVERREFVPTGAVLEEIGKLPAGVFIDYITFSGMGEPTLAANLGEVIRGIRESRREPIALLTNGSLLGRDDVVADIRDLDYISVKIDVPDTGLLTEINRPGEWITVEDIINGIKKLKRDFSGRLAVQVMVVEGNISGISRIADMVREISPYRVELNTPLRPCGVRPISPERLLPLKEYFGGLNIVTVYDRLPERVIPISVPDTERRRGKVDNS